MHLRKSFWMEAKIHKTLLFGHIFQSCLQIRFHFLPHRFNFLIAGLKNVQIWIYLPVGNNWFISFWKFTFQARSACRPIWYEILVLTNFCWLFDFFAFFFHFRQHCLILWFRLTFDQISVSMGLDLRHLSVSDRFQTIWNWLKWICIWLFFLIFVAKFRFRQFGLR